MPAPFPPRGLHAGALVALTAAGALLVGTTFLPWVRSGTTDRSSYDLLGVVDRLGFAPGGWWGTLVRWWPVVPLLVSAAVLLQWAGFLACGFVVAVLASAYAGGTAVALAAHVPERAVHVAVGVRCCVAASIAFLVCSVAVRRTGKVRSERARPPSVPSAHADSR